MALLTSTYLILVSYFGRLMNQFIICSDNCSPSVYFQNNMVCIDYDHCDMDRVIQIKDCSGAANCQDAPAGLHCQCVKKENSFLAELSSSSPSCREIDQRYVNNTMIFNTKFCPPGYYFDRRRFCFEWTCDLQEDMKINWCTINRRCFDTPNYLNCKCRQVSHSIKIQVDVGSQRCLDIDECLQNPCGAEQVCTNKPGSYSCDNKTCIDPNQFNISRCNFIHWDQQIQNPWYTLHRYCSEVNSIVGLVNEQCQAQNGEPAFQKILSTANKLLRNDSLWGNLENEKRFYLASIFLQSVENTVIIASLDLPDQEKRIVSTENIDLEMHSFRGKSASATEIIRLQTKGTFIDINRSRINKEKTMGADFAVAALIVLSNMDSILNGSVYNLGTTAGKLRPFRLISDVFSAVIINNHSDGFDQMVNFTIKHTEEANVNSELHCANWNYMPGESYWSPKGCIKGVSNRTHTQCRCNQLSSLALLLTHFEWQTEPFALTVITYVGIPVSLMCLAVAFGIFAFWKDFKSMLTATHMQLCLSLFLAELLFLIGINQTKNRVVCGIIAGFLHYLFLAAFVWMFLEGVQLYLMVRNIRKLRITHLEKIGKFMYPVGYGVPAIIVAISAAVYCNGYGSLRHCWLQTHRKFIWSFLGPVCAIIGINTFLFLLTLWSLRESVSKRDITISKLQNTRMLSFKAIMQMFILGCSWILGLFHFNEETLVMAYLFTIVNSFQGTFIFVILCVLNPKVRVQCKKWFSMLFRSKTIVSPKNRAAIMPKNTKASSG
ncbi:adhesion G protein-coupled receptor E3-like isoform X1 [Hemiscyllium ocellatum]|uniref:adhesion G protein-coupled receptor E3-like isoform X1 n=1 Tax=Hemiscyllium ocellatum TaxID=170820 RepID=UPI002966DC84|nr:adhesion G protein-coupled receptor E3-like isoform X1 [Hemiscyllium ocellatum]